MEHTTTTDIAALEAEIAALEAEDAAQSARVSALLDGWAPLPATTPALRRLQRTARHAARLSALVERQQAALAAQLDAMEQDA
jgi:septal ring factor EnvC (AmiA/AmiB activator)